MKVAKQVVKEASNVDSGKASWKASKHGGIVKAGKESRKGKACMSRVWHAMSCMVVNVGMRIELCMIMHGGNHKAELRRRSGMKEFRCASQLVCMKTKDVRACRIVREHYRHV